MNKLIIAPSILAVWDRSGGDMDAVVEAALAVEKAGAGWIHVDVMDGQFVPALTFGAEAVTALKKKVKIPLDVHLMVEKPEEVIEDYLQAGADRIVFHPSATQDVRGCLTMIGEGGAVGGLALDVNETIDMVESYMEQAGQVLVMTVKAGAGGQSFRPELAEKIKAVRALLGEEKRLVVDGGINAQTVEIAVNAGADAVVAGNFVFNAENMPEALALLARVA